MQELFNIPDGEIPRLDPKGARLGPSYLDNVPEDARCTPYGIDLDEFIAKGGKII
jgi:hypothetical protein